MERLFVRPAAGGDPVATIGLNPPRLLACADAALAGTLGALLAEPALPLARRQALPGGGRAVGVDKVGPGDRGYAEALGAAIARKTRFVAAAD